MSRCQGADSIITCKAHFFPSRITMSATASASPVLPYIRESSFTEQFLIQYHNTSIRSLEGKFLREEEQVKSMQTLLLKACRYVKLHIKGKKKTDSNTLDDQCNVWKCQYTFFYTKFIHNPLVKEIPFRICNDFYHNSCYIQECYFLNPLLQGNPGKVFQKCNKTWPRYLQD